MAMATEMSLKICKGMLLGTALGMLAGLIALALPQWQMEADWFLILTTVMPVGALTGGFAMAMLGGLQSDMDRFALDKNIAVAIPIHP